MQLLLCLLGVLQAVQLSEESHHFPMNFIGFHHEMINAPDLDKYIASNASINMANSSAAWERLTPREKMYAYYMYQASWRGA